MGRCGCTSTACRRSELGGRALGRHGGPPEGLRLSARWRNSAAGCGSGRIGHPAEQNEFPPGNGRVEFHSGPAAPFRERFRADHLGDDVHQVMLGNTDTQHQPVAFPQIMRWQPNRTPLGGGRFHDDWNGVLVGCRPKGPHSRCEWAGTGRAGIDRNHWLCGFREQLGWRLTVGLFPDYRQCGLENFGESCPD